MRITITTSSKFLREDLAFPDVYDPVRRRLVAATPEEKIRQKLLHRMLNDLGYPKGLIAVEMSLGKQKRRADIVCYRCEGELQPLLIVECKALEISLETQEQAFGYNTALGAPFVCLAGSKEIVTLWSDGKNIVRVPFLPYYRELVRCAVHSRCTKAR